MAVSLWQYLQVAVSLWRRPVHAAGPGPSRAAAAPGKEEYVNIIYDYVKKYGFLDIFHNIFTARRYTERRVSFVCP
jgi:hypothetical protein